MSTAARASKRGAAVALPPLTITISGGEAFERATLVSEIASNLESCDIAVRVDGIQVEHCNLEHEEHIDHLAHGRGVLIINKE